ncbi:carboxylesterase family protein [Streptomyces cinnamoneus]|uniref:carboxylesterase/lipase family protein n=1 Tax=Streptomyces cinnamoneus TaxID=53446 RepID=UPI0033FBB01C
MPPPARSRFIRLLAATAVLLLAVAGCAPLGDEEADAADGHVVTVKSGRLRGTVREGYRLFQGIPYAAPPTGERRWRAPERPSEWEGVRDATMPGSQCPQPGVAGAVATGREDCLFLNVWAPERRRGERAPVMVWLHGGALSWGSGDAYPARRLATQGGIVVVTINYRLGALGYLAHPALANGKETGNYGLMDQQAALRWVKGNVAAFGGDPAKVTVAGESAGGASVCALLNSPASRGLFRAAILQSGPCGGQEAGAARQAGTAFAASLGCFVEATAAGCLRALPASALTSPPQHGARGVSAIPEAPAAPVSTLSYGTALLPGPVAGVPAVKVPVLNGTNRDEVTYTLTGKVPQQDFVTGLKAHYGAKGGAIARAYPRSAHKGDAGLAYGHAVTDGDFACRARSMNRTLSPHMPVYAYEFADPAPVAWSGVQQFFGTKNVLAAHATELPYLFDFPGVAFTEKQQKLSDRMIAYWSSFVSTLDPNGKDRARWYAYRNSTDSFLSLRPTGSVTTNTFGTDHHCGFWQSVEPAQR